MTMIHTKRDISFAHFVNGDTRCAFAHGHNWSVEVWIDGEIMEDGMVFDFNDIKNIINLLDHALVVAKRYVKKWEYTTPNINDVVIAYGNKKIELVNERVIKLDIPEITAENLVDYFINEIYNFGKNRRLYGITVRVYESNESWAEKTKVIN